MQEILSRFRGVVPLKGGSAAYQCKCPVHDDQRASLTITKSGDKILLHCHAGCDTHQILSAVGLTMENLYLNERNPKERYTWITHLEKWKGKRLSAAYHYTDENGKYLYSKLRFEGKDMVFGVLSKNKDEFILGIQGISKTLYNLKKMKQAIQDGFPVYFVEGEKDVDTLAKFGLTATTCGSVNDWKEEYAAFFTGAKVIILPDNDKPGLMLKDRVMKDIRLYAHACKFVITSRKEKGDVTDYIQEGNGKESLLTLVKSVPWQYAPWIFQSKEQIRINGGLLADAVSRTLKFAILKKQNMTDEELYFFKQGVYYKVGKVEMKGYIKKYIPNLHVSDNLLNNVFNLLLCSGVNYTDYERANEREDLINVKNGFYNIKTKMLEPHSSDVLSTLQLGCNYRKDCSPPEKWIHFLEDLCTNIDGEVDDKQIAILQEWAGLILSNVTVGRTKKSLLLYSVVGNTGKSIYIRVLSSILGMGNTINIPIQNLSDRFSLGDIYDKRAVAVGDQKVMDLEDSSVFKQLTGQDYVRAEPKGKQGFDFKFRGGLMFACNGLPYFRDDKGGHVFERILLMKCVNVIPPEKRDPKLFDKLMQEKDSIFMWALAGLHRLLDNNLKFTRSKANEEALIEYRKDIDTLYRFIDENCIITGNKNDRVRKTEFEARYVDWCKNNDYMALSKKNIRERAEKNGINVVKNSIDYYVGIQYKNFADVCPDDSLCPF